MVGAVQGLAALGELLPGRHRLHEYPGPTDLRGIPRLRAGQLLRRRRCSSASPSRAHRSTSSTRRTCDVTLRRARIRRWDRDRRRLVSAPSSPPGCSSPSAAVRQPRRRSARHHRRSASRARRSSSSRSGSAIRSCRRVWCATARSSSPVASRSTSPAASPSASGFPAFASSTSSRRRGCSSPRCAPGISRSPRSGRPAPRRPPPISAIRTSAPIRRSC